MATYLSDKSLIVNKWHHFEQDTSAPVLLHIHFWSKICFYLNNWYYTFLFFYYSAENVGVKGTVTLLDYNKRKYCNYFFILFFKAYKIMSNYEVP